MAGNNNAGVLKVISMRKSISVWPVTKMYMFWFTQRRNVRAKSVCFEFVASLRRCVRFIYLFE